MHRFSERKINASHTTQDRKDISIYVKPMNHPTQILWPVLLVFGLTLAMTTKTNAQEVFCQGTLGDITVNGVRVPSGRTCTLKGTTVLGDVFVEANATLLASWANIKGNIWASEARYVDLGSHTKVEGTLHQRTLHQRTSGER